MDFDLKSVNQLYNNQVFAKNLTDDQLHQHKVTILTSRRTQVLDPLEAARLEFDGIGSRLEVVEEESPVDLEEVGLPHVPLDLERLLQSPRLTQVLGGHQVHLGPAMKEGFFSRQSVRFAPPPPVTGKVRRGAPPSHVEGATVEGRPDIVVGGQDLLDALGHEGVLRDDHVRPAGDPRDPLGRACSDFL